MRVALVFLIILLRGTDNFVIERREHNAEQKLLSRKLLSLQQNNATEKHLVWKEILANAFVNKIKTIFTKQPESEIEDKPDIITKCVAGVIGLFKKYYWDGTNRYPTVEKERNDRESVDAERGDPKDEVEAVEPKYHGRIVNVTEEINVDTNDVTEDFNISSRSVCPGDSVSDGKGNCVDPSNLKYIMAIPYHCPFGYIRDRLGYCRALF